MFALRGVERDPPSLGAAEFLPGQTTAPAVQALTHEQPGASGTRRQSELLCAQIPIEAARETQRGTAEAPCPLGGNHTEKTPRGSQGRPSPASETAEDSPSQLPAHTVGSVGSDVNRWHHTCGYQENATNHRFINFGFVVSFHFVEFSS